MGINDGKEQAKGQQQVPNVNGGVGGPTQQSNGGNAVSGRVAAIGFSLSASSLPILNTSKGSEYTTQFASFLQEAYDKDINNKNKQPKITVLDNAIKQRIAYSVVVVSMLLNARVNYFTILLESTGRGPMRANAIAAEIKTAEKIQNSKDIRIYTADDAIDGVLHNEIRAALAEQYGDMEMVPVDGVVIPTKAVIAYDFCRNIATIGYNACFLDYMLSSGNLKDINIADAKKEAGQTFLRIESNMSRTQLKNLVGDPIRSDFAIKLIEAPVNQQFQSLNLGESPSDLVITTGYVDAIPTPVALPTMPGQAPVTVLRMMPNIVLTSVFPLVGTLGYAMLGLVSSLVMTNQNMWLAGVLPKDKHNTGALNIFTNLENNPNGVGAVLELAGKERTNDETYAVLKQMFLNEVAVSMDVPSFGPETTYLSVFAVAAQQTNQQARAGASAEIIRTANELTNGIFPIDFPVNEIFIGKGVNVPTGTWADKTGERDIRDVDLTFILAQTGDIALANDWAFSNTPKDINGKDPYVEKTKVIASVIPDAEITRKSIRVTFTPKFIKTLADASTAAGLDARYEPEIIFAATTNYDIMNSYFGAAGISNAAGFAKQQMNGNQGFNYNPYGAMGYGRY